MKKSPLFAVLAAILLICSFTYSQQANDDDLISVVTPPAGYNVNPLFSPGMLIETVNGFDN